MGGSSIGGFVVFSRRAGPAGLVVRAAARTRGSRAARVRDPPPQQHPARPPGANAPCAAPAPTTALQLDDAGALEAAKAKRQEEIRARLAAGAAGGGAAAGGAAGGAPAAESAAVPVQQQAADYYTAEEMAKVGAGRFEGGLLGLHGVREEPTARPRTWPGWEGERHRAAVTAPSVGWVGHAARRLLAACPPLPACTPRLGADLRPSLPLAARPQFQKPRKKKERKLKKKALTGEELAALEAEAAARGERGALLTCWWWAGRGAGEQAPCLRSRRRAANSPPHSRPRPPAHPHAPLPRPLRPPRRRQRPGLARRPRAARRRQGGGGGGGRGGQTGAL